MKSIDDETKCATYVKVWIVRELYDRHCNGIDFHFSSIKRCLISSRD